MKPLGDVKRHFWLVKRMAKANGVDVNAAVRSGQLSESDWADVVTRCRTCSHPDTCEYRLAEGELAQDHAPRIPDFCENRDLFRSLSLQPAE
ncbi:MAG: DUF6455 family protein [Pseudooceanicola sp.]